MNEYIESAINNLKLFKEPVCECPVCRTRKREGGLIYEGDDYFYCSNTLKEEATCSFKLKKDNIAKLIRRDITKEEVISLCEEGCFEATCTKIGDDTKHYTGIFKLKRLFGSYGLQLYFTD